MPAKQTAVVMSQVPTDSTECSCLCRHLFSTLSCMAQLLGEVKPPDQSGRCSKNSRSQTADECQSYIGHLRVPGVILITSGPRIVMIHVTAVSKCRLESLQAGQAAHHSTPVHCMPHVCDMCVTHSRPCMLMKDAEHLMPLA
jgi:hypothetical protein